jgi:hypothetical protein
MALKLFTCVEPDGEVISIEHLRLVQPDPATYTVAPILTTEQLRAFAVAVAKSATFNQRSLPLRKKVTILWKVFNQLFLNRRSYRYNDPYILAALEFFAKQLPELSMKDKWTIFKKKVTDLFVFRLDSKDLRDSLGWFGPMKKQEPTYRSYDAVDLFNRAFTE